MGLEKQGRLGLVIAIYDTALEVGLRPTVLFTCCRSMPVLGVLFKILIFYILFLAFGVGTRESPARISVIGIRSVRLPRNLYISPRSLGLTMMEDSNVSTEGLFSFILP
jgi:hypothetical protein